jgi:hypothetical protein
MLGVNGPVCCGECDTDRPDLSEEFDQPTWVDASGKEWRLDEMTDNHLINAYRMVGRIASDYYRGPGPRGEMAQDAYEQELATVELAENELAHEIRRRGLREWAQTKGRWERRKIFA